MINEPAFPFFDPDPLARKDGIQIRDVFAAHAMQAQISNPQFFVCIDEQYAEIAAKNAFIIANAMMKAREVLP